MIFAMFLATAERQERTGGRSAARFIFSRVSSLKGMDLSARALPMRLITDTIEFCSQKCRDSSDFDLRLSHREAGRPATGTRVTLRDGIEYVQ